jgi:predicted XRE-type DNA-binding protein
MRRRGRPSEDQLEKLHRAYREVEDHVPAPLPDTFEARAGYERESLTNQILEAVHKCMREKNVSQQQIAAVMGVSQGRVSQILSGDQNLTLRTLASVAAALDGHFHVTLDSRVSSPVDHPSPQPAENQPRRPRHSV